MMAEQFRLVPDTNVVFKWYVSERELRRKEAERIRDAFLEGHISLLAPDILQYELANLLRVAVEERRLTADDAAQAYADFEASQIPFVRTDHWVHEALMLALVHRISVFDVLFLLVGSRSNARVITDDERLFRVGQAVGYNVERLGDVQLDAT